LGDLLLSINKKEKNKGTNNKKRLP
jgi:hypothetical protein